MPAAPASSGSSLRRLARAVARALRWATTAAAVGALGAYVATFLIPLPAALLQPPDTTVTLEDRAGREIAVVATQRARHAEALPLSEMGRWLPGVTVALEDRNFWTHNGVDVWALGGALCRNMRHGRVISGGSTIAQQLIKNTRPRTGWRWYDKACEALAAVRLLRTWPRERVLAEYLNRIDYGNRRLGPCAAARAYFGKEPADLTLAEAIYLAGLPQAPTRYNPWSRAAAAARRYRRSLTMLAQRGLLDPATRAALGDEPPALDRSVWPDAAPHFVDAVVARQPALRGRVRTTLDLPLQRTVVTLLCHHVERLRGRGVGQAAAVVIDNRDGAVLALVGSADFDGEAGQIDGALLPRSGGSVLKPFLYAEAIERRILTAATVLPDTPDAIRSEYVDYDPQNFDRQHLGPVRVREALASSLNVPAVGALSRIGARTFFERLPQWGFTFPRELEDYGAGLILGNAEPRLLDLAAAFAGFAAEGRVPAWRLLTDEPTHGRAVISPDTAAIITDLLCDDDARRRSFGRGSPLAAPVRVPCKTGTSSGFRDAWTVGSTAEHTVAVWAGNFDGHPMDGTVSIEAAAPLWRAIIDELLVNDTAVPAPHESATLVAAEVCRLTGRRPVAESPGTVREWFLRGTEPTESAGDWLRTVDGTTALTLPPEYATWCASTQNHLGATVVLPAPELAIRQPRAGACYALDQALPRGQQMLRLEAVLPTADSTASWTVDDQPIATTPDGVALWTMSPGDHRAEVVAGPCRTQVTFQVRE
ncbi:MAG TPA: transglycosylase domain-containing protein [Opitutaceae bacterium]|nr:transglycosylase domain-containing protein [Opitutaceae bacterium]